MKEEIKQRLKSLVGEDYPIGWDLDKFKTLSSFAQRIKYCQENLKRIGSGSSRIVYKVDETKVLKLAKNNKGIAQNEVEIEWGQDSYYNDILAQTIESHPDGLWVEMELAKKVSPQKFQEIFGFPCVEVYSYLYNKIKTNNRMKMEQDPRIEKLIDENFNINMVLNFIYDSGSEDIFGDYAKLSSYGLVNRQGAEEIVLIDFGLTSDIYDNYYK